MAKRFTDTEKYRKPFMRRLPVAYKLLWDYIYHDCDYSGVWIVDMELAEFLLLDTPDKFTVAKALELFNEDELRVVPFAGGKKFFIPSFIRFQYGELRDTVSTHKRVSERLLSYGLLDAYNNNDYSGAGSAVAPTVEGTAKDMDKDKVKDKEEVVVHQFSLLTNLVPFFPYKARPKTDKQLAGWGDCLRKLIEMDGHTAEDITLVVQTMRADSFWAGNFLSLLKLRQKDKNGIYFMDRFKMEMTHEHTKGKKGAGAGQLYSNTVNDIAQRHAGTQPDQ